MRLAASYVAPSEQWLREVPLMPTFNGERARAGSQWSGRRRILEVPFEISVGVQNAHDVDVIGGYEIKDRVRLIGETIEPWT
jgi:hypothetical protein